ncbi:MAG: hypothetical protein KDD42_07690 [Bdellovibrionales bacterium]|nr:hypothetical protein [Bdellovibrionales bacterium]
MVRICKKAIFLFVVVCLVTPHSYAAVDCEGKIETACRVSVKKAEKLEAKAIKLTKRAEKYKARFIKRWSKRCEKSDALTTLSSRCERMQAAYESKFEAFSSRLQNFQDTVAISAETAVNACSGQCVISLEELRIVEERVPNESQEDSQGDSQEEVNEQTDAAMQYLKAQQPVQGANVGISLAASRSGVIFAGTDGEMVNGQKRGAVHVFERLEGSSEYQHTARIIANEPRQGKDMGFRIATSYDGRTLVASAISVGIVYVFERAEDGWHETARLRRGQDQGGFGSSLAVSEDGNVIFVAAPGASVYDPEQPQRGRLVNAGGVQIYQRTESGWVPSIFVQEPQPYSLTNCAQDIAYSQGVLVFGCPFAGRGIDYAGWIQLFEVELDGSRARHLEKIDSPNAQEGGYFGFSVAIDSDVLAVGAIGEAETGRAYIFNRDSEGYNVVREVTPINTQNRASFGWDIAALEGRVVVGAPDSHRVNFYAGSVHEYVKRDATWVEAGLYSATPTADRYDRFGKSVALLSDSVIAGAPNEDSGGSDPNDNSLPESGALYKIPVQ